MGDDPAPHHLVAPGTLGVVADDEAIGADADLLHPKVPGNLAVAAGARQRRLGLCRVRAQALADDAVATPALEVAPVLRRVEAPVEKPDHPVQPPGPEVVFDLADDHLVRRLPGKDQTRTEMPSLVTAMASTTWGRSDR